MNNNHFKEGNVSSSPILSKPNFKPNLKELLLYLIFLILLALGCGYGGNEIWQDLVAFLTWGKTEAVLLSKISTQPQPSIRYSYKIGDKSFEGTSLSFDKLSYQEREEIDKYKIGTAYFIYFDPSHPENSVFKLQFPVLQASLFVISLLAFLILGNRFLSLYGPLPKIKGPSPGVLSIRKLLLGEHILGCILACSVPLLGYISFLLFSPLKGINICNIFIAFMFLIMLSYGAYLLIKSKHKVIFDGFKKTIKICRGTLPTLEIHFHDLQYLWLNSRKGRSVLYLVLSPSRPVEIERGIPSRMQRLGERICEITGSSIYEKLWQAPVNRLSSKDLQELTASPYKSIKVNHRGGEYRFSLRLRRRFSSVLMIWGMASLFLAGAILCAFFIPQTKLIIIPTILFPLGLLLPLYLHHRRENMGGKLLLRVGKKGILIQQGEEVKKKIPAQTISRILLYFKEFDTLSLFISLMAVSSDGKEEIVLRSHTRSKIGIKEMTWLGGQIETALRGD